jgi:D-3-phosphoglycerate dehydrogenase
MRVLDADQFSPAGLEEIKSAGIELVYNADLNGESLKAAIAEIKPQALVVRSTKVEKAHIDACSEL